MKLEILEWRRLNPKLKAVPEEFKQYVGGVSNDDAKKKIALLILNQEHEPLCLSCQSPVEFVSPKHVRPKPLRMTEFGGWRDYCSLLCMQTSSATVSKRKASIARIYTDDQGRPVTSWARSSEGKKRLSVPYSFEKKQSWIKTTTENNRLNYDVDWTNTLHSKKEKTEKTNLAKYGVKNVFQIPEQIELARKNSQNVDFIAARLAALPVAIRASFRAAHPESPPEFIDAYERNDNGKMKTYILHVVAVLEEHNITPRRSTIAYFLKISVSLCSRVLKSVDLFDTFCKLNTSEKQEELTQYICSILDSDEVVMTNCRSVLPSTKELDVYIPRLKFGVEFDGLHWHNDTMKEDTNFHFNKKLEAESQGIRLFTVWENEWDDFQKREIICSMIAHRLGKTSRKIHARQCDIVKVGRDEAKNFFEQNHINGTLSHYKVCYGLKFQGELIYCVGFVSPRLGKEYDPDWELGRVASKIQTACSGALSKILREFERNHDPKCIVTSQHRRFSDATSTYVGEFAFVGRSTKPVAYYFSFRDHTPRNWRSFVKEKLKRMFPEYNNEPMDSFLRSRGYFCYWDSGINIFIKRYSK